MASALYRESSKPSKKIESFLIVQEETLSYGVHTYKILMGFRGTEAREGANTWWERHGKKFPQHHSFRYFVWSFDQYEKATGKKFVLFQF